MDENNLVSDLLRIYIAQTDSALKISKVISEHSGEEGISPDAFVTGLIYRSMISMDEEEMKDSLHFADEVLTKENSSSDEDDEEEYDIIDETYNTMEHDYGDKVILSRKIIKNKCNCDICAKARACLINYPTFEADGKLAQMFKDAIDNTLIIHKLNI
jgi:hypothetical protein|tara:strand:+ start:75 stop:548 length:474 start_codon:yes stop_codon:yes gene_type:complete